MTTKEIGELRRRLRPDRTNITAIHGCYVSDSGEVLSSFRQSVALMSEEDRERYLSVFRRVLSGTPDKNLLDLTFRTAQVADSDEHRLLMKLRNSALEDEETLEQLYRIIIKSLSMEGHYLILLAHERYDVPFRGKDGAQLEDGSEVYSYFLCAICPVKPAREALSYVPEEKEFHNRSAGWAAAMPELGFLFPAFDGRRTNLYDCLYYSHSAKDNHAELIDALFRIEAPKPAEEQKTSFQNVLGLALEEECSFRVAQSVHEELSQRIEAHKEMKSDEPLVVSREEVGSVLQSCGVSEEKLAKFNVKFDECFGDDAAVSPRNLIDNRKFQLKTPDVVIQVNPERSDLIQTRTLGGVRYILISADEGVEVNGVNITIGED